MSDGTGTLERLAQEIGLALAPLEVLLTPSNLPNLLVEFGLDTALDVGGDPAFVQKLNLAAQKAAEIGPQLDAVAAAADSGDDTQPIEAVGQLLTIIGELARRSTTSRPTSSGRPRAGSIRPCSKHSSSKWSIGSSRTSSSDISRAATPSSGSSSRCSRSSSTPPSSSRTVPTS